MNYNPALDGLRAIAIILVLFAHANLDILHAGWVGVELFFILSGYLITASLITTKSYKIFYIKRMARIFPALFLFLLVYLIGSYFLNIQNSGVFIGSVLLFFTNWVFAFDLFETNYLTHLWSLAVEEQFYLVYPWLLAIFIGRPKLLLWGFVVLLLYKFHMFQVEYSFLRLYYATDVRASSFLLGALIYFIHDKRLQFVAVNISVFMKQFCLIFSLFFILYISFTDIGKSANYWLFLSNIAIVVLMLCINVQRFWINQLLQLKVLIWIGKLSFALYLWHYPIFKYLHANLGWSPLMVFCIGFPIALILSYLSYYYVEKPILKRAKEYSNEKNIAK